MEHGTKRSRTDGGLEGEVESAEALAFERRSWVVERAGWLVMALVSVAGLLGTFGGGPLGRRALRSDGLEVRYEALVRAGTAQVLEVRVAPDDGREARFALATAYLDRVTVDRVWPTPTAVTASGEWTTLAFATRDRAPVHIRLTLVPERPGLLDGRLRRADGGGVAFRQLVYP